MIIEDDSARLGQAIDFEPVISSFLNC